LAELFKKFDKGLRAFETFVVVIGIISMTFIIFGNAALRYLFNFPLSWAEELSRYIMIWMTFIGASLCVRDNVHVQMDLLQMKLTPVLAKKLFCVTCLVSAIFCAYIGYLGIRLVLVLIRVRQMSTTMEFLPIWVVNLCVPIFGALALKNFVHLFILNLLNKGKCVTQISQEEQL
jgi:C4-dicarboxylate transporter DctQ subunit